MYDFRLQPIVDITQHGATHGYEILAGAHQCPQWTREEWSGWYKHLPNAVDDRTPRDARIFLNVNSEQACDPFIVHAIDHATTMRECVIEWTEDIADRSTYERALLQFRNWRDRGVKIAVDDIGIGQDGIGRVLSVSPHYAKIDCSILDRARETIPAFLKGLRETLEGVGCKVIIEGVEVPDDLRYVQDAGFQYAQGFLYPHSQKLAGEPHEHEVEPIAMAL